MPELIDITVGDLHFSLRVWQAVNKYKTPAVLLHATGKTASDWDMIASGLCTERCTPSTCAATAPVTGPARTA